MNKKHLALGIQVTLFISVFAIGYFTYKAIDSDKTINSKYPAYKQTAGDCPVIHRRPCVEESYTQTPIECPPQPGECNGQDGSQFCYKFDWKNGRKISYCKMCGGDEIDNYNERIIVKCSTKK